MAISRITSGRRAALALGFTVLALLCGCTTPEPPLPLPTSVPTAPPPVPERAPDPVPITLPECDRINPAAEAEQRAFLETYGAENITARYGETDRAMFAEFAGPNAEAAAEAAVQERNCNWVIYLDTVYLYQFTAELPSTEMMPLIEGLRASDYTESTRGPATVFAYAYATGDMRGTVGVTHLFIGEVWIVLIENSALNYEESAVDAILAANPGIAGDNS